MARPSRTLTCVTQPQSASVRKFNPGTKPCSQISQSQREKNLYYLLFKTMNHQRWHSHIILSGHHQCLAQSQNTCVTQPQSASVRKFNLGTKNITVRLLPVTWSCYQSFGRHTIMFDINHHGHHKAYHLSPVMICAMCAAMHVFGWHTIMSTYTQNQDAINRTICQLLWAVWCMQQRRNHRIRHIHTIMWR